MKIIKLHISGYKNLENVVIEFSRSDGKTLIIGNNGTGKSNVLEVLSAIYKALYYKAKNVNPDFRFELEYEIGSRTDYSRPYSDEGNIIRVRNVDGVLEVTANGKTVKRDEWASYLPKKVVAVYSGEEKRLWEQYYFNVYDDFNKQYIRQDRAIEYQKMIYINKYYWDLILSLLAISDLEDHQIFLKERLHITSIEGIHCSFDLKKLEGNKNIAARNILNHINPENKEEVTVSLDKLKELKDVVGYEEDVFFNLAVLLLYKDYKIITSFSVIFNNGLNTKLLSEGEKKLLLIYGALNIFSDECIFLFDEPDAHLHEKRKSEVYGLICQREDSQIVVTSHSPKMIRLFPCVNQIIMRRTAEGELEAITTHEFGEFKEVLDTDITFDEEFAIRESRLPLLLVEGKTDKKHLTTAWEKLYPKEEMPFSIVSLSCADKVRQYILSVPDKFAKSTVIGLVDNDKAGQDVKKGCTQIKENLFKFNNDQTQTKQAYCVLIPFVDDNVKIFNYCPIEFLYNIDILLANGVLKKTAYREAVPKWIYSGNKSIDEETYKTAKEKCFYTVKDSMKNRFSEEVAEFPEEQFSGFVPVFDLVKQVLALAE